MPGLSLGLGIGFSPRRGSGAGPLAPQGGQQAGKVTGPAFFASGSFGTSDTTGGFSNA